MPTVTRDDLDAPTADDWLTLVAVLIPIAAGVAVLFVSVLDWLGLL